VLGGTWWEVLAEVEGVPEADNKVSALTQCGVDPPLVCITFPDVHSL
jgi:hypothetical protein